MSDVDYHTLSRDQLIARLQIAVSEHKHLKEENANLHRMIGALREAGWSTPRGPMASFTIKDYPMGGGGDVDRKDLAKRLVEANDRADHWRKKYMDLLDETGRSR